MVSHPDVDTVILTGGTDTALAMLKATPELRLLAETGGKNATIVTALADRDQAIKNVIHSAFGHSGQKCSATSLLVLEREVYEDEKFKRSLCDAIKSMHVGSAWEPRTKIGPLIRPPSGVLDTALKELEDGETWAVMPRRDRDNPHLYSPAVKWGVRPGSFTHCTEFFGPVLGVMQAKDIHEAIELVNQTGYGLTSGIESLDDRERRIWRESIRAGNLYINRGTTGAIVLRQPFGGMGKSAFGPGIKAGGPNYVVQLMRFTSQAPAEHTGSQLHPHLRSLSEHLLAGAGDHRVPLTAETARALQAAIGSYADWFDREFGREHDHFKLIGQDNIRRYLPVKELRIRVHPDDQPFDIIGRVAAAKTVGCRVTVSTPTGNHPLVRWLDDITESWAGAIEFVEESDEKLAAVIRGGQTQRIRYAAASHVPTPIREVAGETGLFVADEPVLGQGRIELLWYVEEQSISDSYHRYGNLGGRADEERIDVA